MTDAVIQFRGTIYENGYGLIAQKVMRDKDLTPTAKSIYAYICSFAGVGKDGERTAFPGVSLMKQELGIKTNGAYYKHRNQLIEKGYLSIEKKRGEGQKFDNNLYIINAVPVESKPKTKPLSDLPTMEKTDPLSDLPTTETRTAAKQTTNSNRSLSLIDLKKEEEEEENAIAHNESINQSFENLVDFLFSKGHSEITAAKIIKKLQELKCTEFDIEDCKEQFNRMLGKEHTGYETYFANGIASLTEQRRINSKNKKQERRSPQKGVKTEIVPEWIKNRNKNANTAETEVAATNENDPEIENVLARLIGNTPKRKDHSKHADGL